MGIRPARPDERSGLRRGLAGTVSAVRAICPTTARTRLRWALTEQEALRRVATLVAHGASPSETFWVVCRELGRILKADYVGIGRFEPDDMVCHLAEWHDPSVPAMGVPFGGRWPMGDTAAAAVYRTGRSARRSAASVASELGDWLRSHEVNEVVAGPVTVHGRLWGEVSLRFRTRSVPEDIEERMRDFVELVACTIAQAEHRAELITSRARLVMVSDLARRRLERDLHDGAQQRLIALGLYLREADESAPAGDEALRAALANAARCQADALAQIQEVARGLRPTVLTKKGLKGAVEALACRSPVPTEVRVDLDRRLPEPIEITLYYVASEALANILKHANASLAHLDLCMNGDAVRLTVRDDGVGGADPRHGTGLTGLRDRVEAVGGTMEVTSPDGDGTSLVVRFPHEAL
jgi:signal transduction histidine kinase